MLRLRYGYLAAVLLWSVIPSSAAVLLTSTTGTIEEQCYTGTCFGAADWYFQLPTPSYIAPTFAAGPVDSAPLPPRFNYRIVLTAAEPATDTFAYIYPNYTNINYFWENGTFREFGGDENHSNEYVSCSDNFGFCLSSGYVSGNQAIFTFGDGINNLGPYGIDTTGLNYHDVSSILIGYNGTVSVSAFFDPELAGMAFTADVFQIPAVPEPATWALLILGFGLVGFKFRLSRSADAAAQS